MSLQDWTEAEPLVLIRPLGSPSPETPPQAAPGGTLTIRREQHPGRPRRPSSATAGIGHPATAPARCCHSQITGCSPGTGCHMPQPGHVFSLTHVLGHPGPGGGWKRSPITLPLQPDPCSTKPALRRPKCCPVGPAHPPSPSCTLET